MGTLSHAWSMHFADTISTFATTRPTQKTFLFTNFEGQNHADMMDHNISSALKVAALLLDCPSWSFPLN